MLTPSGVSPPLTTPPVASQQAQWLTAGHGDTTCLVPSKVSPPSALSPLGTACPPALWGQLVPTGALLHVWLPEAVEEGAGVCVYGDRRGNEPPDFTAAGA